MISGTAQQGQTLVATSGTWANNVASYLYAWEDCDTSGDNCVNIGGATASGYTLQASDVGATLRSVVTASNSGGSVSARSAATAVVVAEPPAAFSFAPASPTTGQNVHFDASSSTCQDTPCTYTWSDNPPSGGSWALGTGPTLDFVFRVTGTKYVTLTVTDASNNSATVEHDVVVTAAQTVSAPSNTALPVISGTATQGQTLTTSNGSWNGSPTAYAYQWRQCDASGNNCTNITGGTSSSYTLAAGDVGQTVRVVVTATNAGGSTPATSAQTSAVASSGGGTSCSLNATTSNFASQVLAASAGQTICLASGNYGTWNGTSKAITVTAASGASPQMQVNFGSSANGFTLNGMTGMGGSISAGATNVIIENSTFTSTIDIEGATHDVVLDHNTHNWMVGPSTGGPNAKLFVDVSGTLAAPALTVENSDIENGDLDGVHVGSGSGLVVLNNTFKNLCDMGANHTDNIQFEGGTQIRIAGNYLYEAQNCPTQGITSYDGGTNGLIIEDNVVDVPRDWGIELYSDQNSIVRHNTVVYHPKSYSEFNTGTGDIDIDRKSQDPAGTGTHVYDNVASVSFANGSSGSADHNTDPSTVSYVGGAPGPSSVFSDLFLTGTSPGHNAASDGFDTGIRHSIS
ncbi:MAG: right-handed parallel beta-helix repeat-containing protein [Ilumatobacteraceae bacterium]